jgi:sugar lactone lactonase YvrE
VRLPRTLGLPESPRWHEGRLWFADMGLGVVCALAPEGGVETIVEVEGRPGGLGWLPDGRLLVVSMRERRLLREDRPGSRRLVEAADLAPVAPFHCNDMVVDADGRAYVGNFGFDLPSGEALRPTVLARVDPEGEVSVVATDLVFPNGMVLTPGGELIVAESFADRLTAFAVRDDGSLGERRRFADVRGLTPDGICLDAEGAVWLASANTGDVVRVAPGGERLDRISTGFAGAYACVLGAPDGKTLFVCVAQSGDEDAAAAAREGAILRFEVGAPRAGRP